MTNYSAILNPNVNHDWQNPLAYNTAKWSA